MKMKFNEADLALRSSTNQQRALLVYPPPILFTPVKGREKDTKSSEKEKYKTVDVPLDHTNQNSDTTEWPMPIFEDGSTEDWVKWRIQFDELAKAYPLDTSTKKMMLARTLLRGLAKDSFETGTASVTGRNASDDDKWNEGMKSVSSRYFNSDPNAWRRQRNYMRYYLFFTDSNFMEFKNRLLELNKYLPYFPAPTGGSATSLKDDELVEILDSAKPIEYQQQLLTANYDPYAKTFAQYSQYLQNLEPKRQLEHETIKGILQPLENVVRNPKSRRIKKIARKKVPRIQRSHVVKGVGNWDIEPKTVGKTPRTQTNVLRGTRNREKGVKPVT